MARVGLQHHGGGGTLVLFFKDLTSFCPLTSSYTVQLGVLIFNLRWFYNVAVRQAYRTRTFQFELHSLEDTKAADTIPFQTTDCLHRRVYALPRRESLVASGQKQLSL